MRLLAEQAFDAGERAQLLAHALDRRGPLLALLAELGEAWPSGLVVGEQLPGEGAAADLLEDTAQRLADPVVDDTRATRKVAVLGDVRDGVAHVLEPALIEQVDDQLELVEALVIRDLRLVARLEPRPGWRRRRGRPRRPACARRWRDVVPPARKRPSRAGSARGHDLGCRSRRRRPCRRGGRGCRRGGSLPSVGLLSSGFRQRLSAGYGLA